MFRNETRRDETRRDETRRERDGDPARERRTERRRSEIYRAWELECARRQLLIRSGEETEPYSWNRAPLPEVMPPAPRRCFLNDDNQVTGTEARRLIRRFALRNGDLRETIILSDEGLDTGEFAHGSSTRMYINTERTRLEHVTYEPYILTGNGNSQEEDGILAYPPARLLDMIIMRGQFVDVLVFRMDMLYLPIPDHALHGYGSARPYRREEGSPLMRFPCREGVTDITLRYLCDCIAEAVMRIGNDFEIDGDHCGHVSADGLCSNARIWIGDLNPGTRRVSVVVNINEER